MPYKFESDKLLVPKEHDKRVKAYTRRQRALLHSLKNDNEVCSKN